MKKKKYNKILREGNYLAEVEVGLIETEDEWSPYLSLKDAEKLDEVRRALRNEDFKKAQKFAKVYLLKPLAV